MRFLIQRSICDRFVADLASRLSSLKVGDPTTPLWIWAPVCGKALPKMWKAKSRRRWSKAVNWSAVASAMALAGNQP